MFELLDQPYAFRVANENTLIRERLRDEVCRGRKVAGFCEGGCKCLANRGQHVLIRLID